MAQFSNAISNVYWSFPVNPQIAAVTQLLCSTQLQRFLSVHDQVANQFMRCRYSRYAKQKRELCAQALAAWNEVA